MYVIFLFILLPFLLLLCSDCDMTPQPQLAPSIKRRPVRKIVATIKCNVANPLVECFTFVSRNIEQASIKHTIDYKFWLAFRAQNQSSPGQTLSMSIDCQIKNHSFTEQSIRKQSPFAPVLKTHCDIFADNRNVNCFSLSSKSTQRIYHRNLMIDSLRFFRTDQLIYFSLELSYSNVCCTSPSVSSLALEFHLATQRRSIQWSLQDWAFPRCCNASCEPLIARAQWWFVHVHDVKIETRAIATSRHNLRHVRLFAAIDKWKTPHYQTIRVDWPKAPSRSFHKVQDWQKSAN